MDTTEKLHTRNKVCCTNLTELPTEIQVRILKKLTFKELIAVKKVSKYFAGLVEEVFPTLLKDLSLPNVFPNTRNMNFLSWLSLKGNLEATIKLGIAYLYHEGLTDTASSRQESSLRAVEYFSAMERSEELKSPVMWMLVRPPWSSAAVCRKAYVVKNLIKLAEDTDCHPRLIYCIGKVFHLFEDDAKKQESARNWMQRAADAGLPDAIFELWKMDLKRLNEKSSIESLFFSRDPGLQLSLLRQLRKLAEAGYYPAKLQLCRLYALGYYGGLPTYSVMKSVQDLFRDSSPTCHMCFSSAQPRMNGDMRLILIDWLIEVATLKNFSSETLHATTQCVDRFLQTRECSRSYLQLLGIACMVLCSRCFENDVLTIREAVWLTDSAYKYEELVRMMGDVVSTLKGNVKAPSTYDYLSVLLNFSDISKESKEISKFICDASLLYEDVSTCPPATVAASCVLIANLTTSSGDPWSNILMEFTGLSSRDVARTAIEIHRASISREFLAEYSNLKFNCVEERFSETPVGSLKLSQIVSVEDLTTFFQSEDCRHLVVAEETCCTNAIENSGVSNFLSEFTKEDLECNTEIWSSDEELENDTPPTFSCAYLVQPDTKTRKRIRMKSTRQTISCDSPLTENDTASAASALGSADKNFPSKKRYLCEPNMVKSRSLSPEAVSVRDKENSCVFAQPKSSLKLVGRPRTPPPSSSKSMKWIR